MKYPMETIRRFWSRVDISNPQGCWMWTGCHNGHFYGTFYANGKQIYVHRFAYEIAKGEIPEGLTIDHLCRNTMCVNPKHLEAVTQKVNCLRGNSLSARRARQTHCKRGHPLSGDNLYLAGGRRMCKTCRENYRLVHQEEIRAAHKKKREEYWQTHTKEINRGERNGQSKLTEEQVLEIYRLAQKGMMKTKIGKMFGVSDACVVGIAKGKRWSWLTGKFKRE